MKKLRLRGSGTFSVLSVRWWSWMTDGPTVRAERTQEAAQATLCDLSLEALAGFQGSVMGKGLPEHCVSNF